MTGKRFTNHDDTILDTDGEQLISTDEIVDKMNELHEENIELHIQNDFLKDENQHMRDLVNENKQLKAQLYCDDEEGVCNICKHHYLVKDDETELGYYNSRCKKGHYECASISLKFCEDFEKELEE